MVDFDDRPFCFFCFFFPKKKIPSCVRASVNECTYLSSKSAFIKPLDGGHGFISSSSVREKSSSN